MATWFAPIPLTSLPPIVLYASNSATSTDSQKNATWRHPQSWIFV